MLKNYIAELRWRGVLQDAMPQPEEELIKAMTKGYAGFLTHLKILSKDIALLLAPRVSSSYEFGGGGMYRME